MNHNIKFNAPWGKSLKLMTGLSILFLGIIIPLIGISSGHPGHIGWIIGMVIIPLSILAFHPFL